MPVYKNTRKRSERKKTWPNFYIYFTTTAGRQYVIGPKISPQTAERALIAAMRHPDVVPSSVYLVEDAVEGIPTTDAEFAELRDTGTLDSVAPHREPFPNHDHKVPRKPGGTEHHYCENRVHYTRRRK